MAKKMHDKAIIPADAVDAANLTRLLEQEEMADRAGLALDHPVFELGHRVNATGVRNLADCQKKFNDGLGFSYVCDGAKERIAGEDRRDIEVDLGACRMRADGRLTVAGRDGEWLIGRAGTLGLLNGLGVPSGSNYLLNACPPDLRAENLNYFFRQCQGEGGKTWILRDRKAGAASQAGEREIMAAVSRKYTACDADVLATIAAETMPRGARGELKYNGERFSLGASWVTDIAPEHCCAGEVFRLWTRLTSRDNGQGGIGVELVAERNLCLNLIIIGKARHTIRLRHQGDRQELRDAVAAAVEAQGAKVELFTSGWTAARRANLESQVLAAGKYGIEAVMRGLVEADLVRVPGMRAAALTEKLVRAWQQEPGYTIADFSNAISRAATEETWKGQWGSEDLQEQAGELLYQRVYVVEGAIEQGLDALRATV